MFIFYNCATLSDMLLSKHIQSSYLISLNRVQNPFAIVWAKLLKPTKNLVVDAKKLGLIKLLTCIDQCCISFIKLLNRFKI
jgi:hypothetical protein